MSNLRKAQAHLARAAYYGYRFGTDDNDCVICFHSLQGEGETLTCPNTKKAHTFHKECIFQFIKGPSEEKNVCPTCKIQFFNDTQIKALPPDIQALINSNDDEVVQLNNVTPAQLNHMLHDSSAIQNIEFINTNWLKATIGSQEIVYSFIRCTFKGDFTGVNISNIQFHSCIFNRNRYGFSTVLDLCQLHSVKFTNVKFQNIDMQQATFDKCNFEGIAYNANFRFCTFKNGVMHDFDIEQKDDTDDDAGEDEYYDEDDAIMYKCKFNNMTFESCEWNHVDCNSSEFVNCTMINCNFSGSNMTGVTFTHCTFKQCNFKTTWLRRCIFKACTIKECKFTEADLTKSIFSSGSTLKCAISHCNFTETVAQNVSFLNCMLVSNTFKDTFLQYAKFIRNTLRECEFSHFLETTPYSARLLDADFTESTLLQCSFESDRQHVMRGAKFNKTNITDCKFHSHLEDVDFTESHIQRTALDDPSNHGDFTGAIIDGVTQHRRSKRIRNA